MCRGRGVKWVLRIAVEATDRNRAASRAWGERPIALQATEGNPAASRTREELLR